MASTISINDKVTDQITYAEFIKLSLTCIPEMNLLKKSAAGMEYSGFTPQVLFKEILKILKKKGKTVKQAAEDISFLITYFFVRGANIANLKEGNTEGGAQAVNNIKELFLTYDIKSTPGTEDRTKAITLPRLCMTFAPLSHEIFVRLERQMWPVSPTEIRVPNSSFAFPNFVPCLIDHHSITLPTHVNQAKVFFLHVIYQCFMSYKTQLGKKTDLKEKKKTEADRKPVQHFYKDSTTYSKLGMEGTMSSDIDFKEYSNYLIKEPQQAVLTEDNIILAMYALTRTGIPMEIAEPVTKYHVILNAVIEKKIALDAVKPDLLMQNYDTLLDKYN